MWVGPKYANPELGPESLDNFEAGLDLIPAEGVKVTLSAYFAAGTDFCLLCDNGRQFVRAPYLHT
jgi:iron complex outermembrane receptor protein